MRAVRREVEGAGKDADEEKARARRVGRRSGAA